MGVFEPAGDGGHAGGGGGVEQGRHGAAVGVAADGEVARPKGGDGELDDGADAAKHLAVGRNHVADVAGNEDLAGAGAGDLVGIDAGVGAGDEEGVGALGRVRGSAVEVGVLGEDLGAETADAGFELFEDGIHRAGFRVQSAGRGGLSLRAI